MGIDDGCVVEPTTLIGKTHAALKKNIIAGLHQPGEQLRIDCLRKQYGISGGVVREALTLLVADRLVVAERQVGFTVALLTAEDLIHLRRVRIILEKEAIRQSINYGNDEWETNVITSAHVLSRAAKAFACDPKNHELLIEWERRHRNFHLSLFSATECEWTCHFLALLYQQYERYRHLFLAVAEGLCVDRDAEAEHTAIVDAVLARDADEAERLIEEHISQSIDAWAGYFKTAGSLELSLAAAHVDKAE